MKIKEVSVISQVDGTEHKAVLAQCEHCSSSDFKVFQLTGQVHFHLQCSICSTSFCPQGCGQEGRIP